LLVAQEEAEGGGGVAVGGEATVLLEGSGGAATHLQPANHPLQPLLPQVGLRLMPAALRLNARLLARALSCLCCVLHWRNWRQGTTGGS